MRHVMDNLARWARTIAVAAAAMTVVAAAGSTDAYAGKLDEEILTADGSGPSSFNVFFEVILTTPDGVQVLGDEETDRTMTSDADSADQLTAGGGERSPLSTVQKVGNTLVVDCVGGWHTLYIIGVEGVPGAMTVNFDNWATQLYFDVANIDVNFAGGNNQLAVFQVNVAGDVDVSAGDGDNEFVLGLPAYNPNYVGGDLSVVAGHGANSIRVEETWVIGNAAIAAGDGDNNVVFGQAGSPSDLGAVVLGELAVATGGGADLIEVAKCWLNDNVSIETAGGDDAVILGTNYANGSPIAGNVFNADLNVTTGEGNDDVGLTDNAVFGNTDIRLNQDDDALLLGLAPGFPPNSFGGTFEARGGLGMDGFSNDPGNAYAVAPVFINFELEAK